MKKFTSHSGKAVAIYQPNIDTDQIAPKKFLLWIQRAGFAEALFAERRFEPDGTPKSDFILNQPRYEGSSILLTGKNFGCGSSREHAPWALEDFGFKVIIASSFADIFYNNCFKNGILPIVVSPENLKKLLDDAERGANATLTIDLPSQEIRGPDGGTVKFEIDAFRKHCLLNGLDDIGLTMEKEASITAFEKNNAESHSWL